MDKNTLDQANSLISTIKALDDLNFVINRPYPQFYVMIKVLIQQLLMKKHWSNLKRLLKTLLKEERLSCKKSLNCCRYKRRTNTYDINKEARETVKR